MNNTTFTTQERKVVRIETVETIISKQKMEVEKIRDRDTVFARGEKPRRLCGEGTNGFSIVLKLQKRVSGFDRIEITAPKSKTDYLDIHPLNWRDDRVVSSHEVFQGKSFVTIPVEELERILNILNT